MKKILFSVFALVAALSFVGCDVDKKSAGLSTVAYYVQFDTPKDQFVEVGGTYTAPEVEATVNGEPFTLEVVMTDMAGEEVTSVDTSEVGVYKVTYIGYNDADPNYPTTTSGFHYVIVYDDAAVADAAAIAGTYNVDSASTTISVDEGAATTYADSEAYTVEVKEVANGIYRISDLAAAWYRVHEGHGSSYSLAAFVAIDGTDVTPLYYIPVVGWEHLKCEMTDGALTTGAAANLAWTYTLENKDFVVSIDRAAAAKK